MEPWLRPDELRVGLGCMRLETEALETIAAAAGAGITVFDTARAYEGSEALLARALRGVEGARIVTKGGMSRPGGAWVPDGRARSLRADCEASLETLEGIPIDLYLVHVPDPRRAWRTSVRALAKLVDDGLVARVGVANVNREQLDEAVGHAPIAAVQVAVSPFDDRALRGGVVERCVEHGIAVLAHSPLGGPRRASRLARNPELADSAAAHGATPAEVALAWLLALAPNVVALPGATRPETARSAARAASLHLADDELERLDAALGRARAMPPRRPPAAKRGEVVVVMGIPGAGKTRVAEEYVGHGYVRLNRDERGGPLRGLANELDDALAAGSTRVVLDNTYLTRASRSYVLQVAARHGVAARCVWLDTPLAQAQVNLVERLLDRYGDLPTPERLAELARREAGALPPTRQMRAFRELEKPSADEGFAAVEVVSFERAARPGAASAGVLVAAVAVGVAGWESVLAEAIPSSPHLVFDWRPDGDAAELAPVAAAVSKVVTGRVDAAVCPHPAGPPVCWCRPPLPGLALVFARAHDVDLSRSVLVGASPAHRTLANTLSARCVTI
jgi:aryl-alcohol dehydrogenase-like predicted oxidoreductase/predicted kinase